MNNEQKVIQSILLLSKAVKTIREGLWYEIGCHTKTGEKVDRLLKEFNKSFDELLLKKRSSKRRRVSPKGRLAMSAKRMLLAVRSGEMSSGSDVAS